MRGYHFTGERLRNGDPIPAIGTWLVHEGPLIPCTSGLHASAHPFDALPYAPGPWLHQVALRGELRPHGNPVDKWVGRQRCIVATIDATALLWSFAKACARDVLHLWDAPDAVRDYLMCGDETLRTAAETAAWAATEAAAQAVAWTAAEAAAWAAAWTAAEAAARETQRQCFLALVQEAFAHAANTPPRPSAVRSR